MKTNVKMYYFECECSNIYFNEEIKSNCPKCKKFNLPKSFETYNKNKVIQSEQNKIINIEV